MNIFQKTLEVVQGRLESVCIDIGTCPEKFGMSGTSKTGVEGCVQGWHWSSESKFLTGSFRNWDSLENSFGHVQAYFEVSGRFCIIDAGEDMTLGRGGPST